MRWPFALGLAAALVCWLALSAAQAAEGDAGRGERQFQRCYSCHSVDPNETGQLQGPSLFRIVGRRAASVAGFEYSDAMKAKGARGLVWTPEALDRFMADPDAFVAQVKGLGAAVQVASWPDHHEYREEDVAWLARASRKADHVVITEKDAVKLRHRWPASAPEPLWLLSASQIRSSLPSRKLHALTVARV